MGKLRRISLAAAGVFALCGLGLAGAILADRVMNPLPAESHHTEYDPQLGWINRPSVAIANMYGPGIYFSTTEDRLRTTFAARRDPSPLIACSGDSFTLGYGVSDTEAWCALLMDGTGWSSLNLGQGGYGFDQSYLWSERQLGVHKPAVHVVAFVPWDFERMRYTTFQAFGKPRLRVGPSGLTVENIPVPRAVFHFPSLANSPTLIRLGVSHFIGGPIATRPALTVQETEQIVSQLVSSYCRAGDGRMRTVFVALPSLAPRVASNRWSELVRRRAEQCQARFLDLTRLYDREESQAVYLGRSPRGFPMSAGHYTAYGNRLVAEALRPQVADQLHAR